MTYGAIALLCCQPTFVTIFVLRTALATIWMTVCTDSGHLLRFNQFTMSWCPTGSSIPIDIHIPTVLCSETIV
jgi:hypothetical protein